MESRLQAVLSPGFRLKPVLQLQPILPERGIERHLRQYGCVLYQHGGNHDVWLNTSNLAQTPVPRHSRIKRGTVRCICRILAAPCPPGF
ncbi:MAG: type II toxin-antitoxin system HicA family toxin [Thermoguttaceae bacterium]